MAEILTQHYLTFCLWNLHNDGQQFSEMARLTSSYTYDFMCMFSLLKSSRAKTWPQLDHLLWPCKVAKHHADACTPVDLYQIVGGSSKPPEPPESPQHTGLPRVQEVWFCIACVYKSRFKARLVACIIYPVTSMSTSQDQPISFGRRRVWIMVCE